MFPRTCCYLKLPFYSPSHNMAVCFSSVACTWLEPDHMVQHPSNILLPWENTSRVWEWHLGSGNAWFVQQLTADEQTLPLFGRGSPRECWRSPPYPGSARFPQRPFGRAPRSQLSPEKGTHSTNLCLWCLCRWAIICGPETWSDSILAVQCIRRTELLGALLLWDLLRIQQ